MRVGKEWRVINDGDPQVLIRELGLSAIAARVLVHRGVSDPDAARRFLSPSLSDLPDPSVMKDMDRAVARVSRALRSREKIHVFGDYDVDGTTATAVLCLFLRNAGAEVSFSVPDRTREGYGLNAEAVKRIAASGARLLITADCGIASRDEIRWAAGEGLDVVVTDHHEPPEELPPAVAVLNPKRNDCPYPFKGLAGVGVAFHLLIALRARLREEAFFPPGEVPNLREYLDLVALGTIADVVPLTGPNRILAKHGLAELGRSRRPGIAALKALCTLADAPLIDTEAVHFRLAPRINAAGRMRDAAQAVELFTTGDPARARRIASDLDELNSVRQRTEEAILNEAREMIESGGEGKKSIVLSSAKWHPGIVGIVASRLVEEYQCPAVLIALGDETGRGSGRSIAGFSLYEALKSCSRWMERFGGHDQAGGLVIRSENIPFFAAAFESAAAEMLSGGDGVPVLE
ncbi:MAG TPA: single-stranded-DNA-specific exonuclease RecJ, partial [Thermodesulfobacteriota bacterium]|nr:single-stranded-DNA-specific exonuclease RecJ [Thermodesulfobacteriota bacterium]